MNFLSYRYQYLIPIIIGFIILFNILAMIGLYSRRKHRDHLIRLLLLFFWNLCFCELSVGIVLLANTVLYWIGKEIIDYRIQKSRNYMEYLIIRVSLVVSTLTLLIVTIIRIKALTKTYFRYRINRTIVIRINIAIWVFALVLVGTYKCIFDILLSNEYLRWRYEGIFIPVFIIPSIFVLTGCHMVILRILHTHGMSMQTYLETMRNYVSKRSSKKKSTWNIFATLSRSTSNKTQIQKATKQQVANNQSFKDNQFQSKNNVIIENNYVCDTNDKRKHKLNFNNQQSRIEQDKERCKRQVEALFSTKDISLLRFIVLTFLICWLPLSLVELFHMLNIGNTWYIYNDMKNYTLLIVFLKSAITPFIIFLNKRKGLVCCSRNDMVRLTEDSTLKSNCSTVTTIM